MSGQAPETRGHGQWKPTKSICSLGRPAVEEEHEGGRPETAENHQLRCYIELILQMPEKRVGKITKSQKDGEKYHFPFLVEYASDGLPSLATSWPRQGAGLLLIVIKSQKVGLTTHQGRLEQAHISFLENG